MLSLTLFGIDDESDSDPENSVRRKFMKDGPSNAKDVGRLPSLGIDSDVEELQQARGRDAAEGEVGAVSGEDEEEEEESGSDNNVGRQFFSFF